MKRPTAIVLGGIAAHIKLIESLQNRGYYVVLIDYYDDPPARKTADLHVKESTLDKEKVLELAEQMSAEVVIASCAEHANATACYVAEKLGLTKPYSYETSIEVTNKAHMKRRMKDNQIPTSGYVICSDLNDIQVENLTYPIVVKPVDSNGSKGVKKVTNSKLLKHYIEEAISLSRAKKAIVEEFVDGDEIQIDCFAGYDSVDVIMIRKRLKIKTLEGQAMQSFGSMIPANISKKAKDNIFEIALNIKKSLWIE